MSVLPTQSPEQLADAVVRHIDRKDVRRALDASRVLTQNRPDYAYGWYLASYVLRLARNSEEAIKAIDQALKLTPTDKYRLHKLRCQFEAGDLAGAIATAGDLKDRAFDTAALHGEMGSLLHLVGDYSAALRHYSRAIELDSGVAELHFSRAAVLRYLGEIDAAEAGFNAAISLRPQEFEAYNARAQLRRQTPERNHVAELMAAIARTRDPVGLTQLYYALAKEQEDLGHYHDAFASLQRGAELRRERMQYSVETDIAIMATIRETYTAERFNRRSEGCAAPDPIFIVGMPRTGTTLIERVLGSHSQVFAAGELSHFSLELLRLVGQRPGPVPASRLDFVAASATLDFRALGEAYVGSTRALRDHKPFFIDKLPFNFLYAGLIHLALPRARIINLERHPLDTCFAVYKQLFKDAYPFSYDLDELGRYYLAYVELMRHWNAVMPGVIHTVRYEHVVADLEGEARRLLDHCGLPWEDEVLRFHRNPRASTTASATQVRQPIYDTSVGKWRKFAPQLEPLRLQLECAGIATEGP